MWRLATNPRPVKLIGEGWDDDRDSGRRNDFVFCSYRAHSLHVIGHRKAISLHRQRCSGIAAGEASVGAGGLVAAVASAPGLQPGRQAPLLQRQQRPADPTARRRSGGIEVLQPVKTIRASASWETDARESPPAGTAAAGRRCEAVYFFSFQPCSLAIFSTSTFGPKSSGTMFHFARYLKSLSTCSTSSFFEAIWSAGSCLTPARY